MNRHLVSVNVVLELSMPPLSLLAINAQSTIVSPPATHQIPPELRSNVHAVNVELQSQTFIPEILLFLNVQFVAVRLSLLPSIPYPWLSLNVQLVITISLSLKLCIPSPLLANVQLFNTSLLSETATETLSFPVNVQQTIVGMPPSQMLNTPPQMPKAEFSLNKQLIIVGLPACMHIPEPPSHPSLMKKWSSFPLVMVKPSITAVESV
jgi:hypothetical protein